MSLSLKYKYRDASTLRWVNDLSHFEDKFNPDNNQYFGNKYVADLLIKDDYYDGIHRLVLTEYDIDRLTPYPFDLKVWFISENSEVELTSVVTNDIDNIYYVTIFSETTSGTGRLEIRSGGVTYKYSECVKFVTGTDHIVLHTRNYFDKSGIKWGVNPVYNWIRTTLPANDLGLTNVNPEREIQYIGGRNSPESLEARNDLSIEYEFLVAGKARILDAIEILSGNVYGNDDQGGFYLNLIRLTPEGDMDRADDSINGTMTYLVQKNDSGAVIEVDDNLIFSDLKPEIRSLQPSDESSFTVGVDNTFVIEVDYNQNVQLTTDATKEIRLFKDSFLIETFTINNVVGVTGTLLQIKLSDTYPLGEYNIEIDDNFVLETTFGAFGANGIPSSIYSDWTFSVEEFKIHNDIYNDIFN